MSIIDIFTHLFPEPYFKALMEASPKVAKLGGGKRLSSVKTFFDLDARFREMDVLGDYRQVVTLPGPPLEDVVEGPTAAKLARMANDGLAEICAKHPDRFAAFAATVCLDDMDEAARELERAITQLGARGIQIYSNIAGHPLDEPRFDWLFAAMRQYDLPIWLHPTRTAAMTDYASEPRSRYEMWWCFGWPYETTIAVTRLVFSGVFDRHPGLKLITHHLGGMIPFYEGRLGPGMEVLGHRTSDEDYSEVLSNLKRPHLDYFHDIYADTAMFGGSNAMRCGFDFFGSDHVVFGSDAPLVSIPKLIEAVDTLDLTAEQRTAIMSGNAKRLLNLAA